MVHSIPPFLSFLSPCPRSSFYNLFTVGTVEDLGLTFSLDMETFGAVKTVHPCC